MTRTIDLVGPKGYVHGWHYVGAPGKGAHVFHPQLGHGVVTSHDGSHATVKFDKAGSRTFEARKPAKGELAQPHLTSPDAGQVQVWDVKAGKARTVPRAEAAAGHARYARSLGAGTPAAAVGEKRAMQIAKGEEGKPEWKRVQESQAAKADAAGKASARSVSKQMAVNQAQRIRVKETTGLTIPSPTEFQPGAGRSHVADANNWLMHGRLSQAEDSLGSAQAEAYRAGAKGAATKLAKFRSLVQRAHVRSAPPPLVKTGTGKNGINAIDHLGTRYTVSLSGGKVTVTGPGGTLSAPSGTDPTRTARELAGRLGDKKTVAAANPSGRAISLSVKTPAPERAANRRKLAAAGQALPGGEEIIPDVEYLKKAIRSVGRLDPAKRPALKALIVKRARELKAASAPGVKGTWAFQAANDDSEALEMAMPARRMPVVRGQADVQASRSAPGVVAVQHKSTGMRIGTVNSVAGGFRPVHASGKTLPASPTMGGAMAGLIAWHNKQAAQKAATASAMTPAPSAGIASVKGYAGDQEALDFATPAVSASDGPRVTSMSGGKKPASVPAAKLTMAAQGGGTMTAEVAKVYKKLIGKGLKPAQAMALAKRASVMHQKAVAKKAA